MTAFWLWLGALLSRYGQRLAPVRHWEAGVSAPQDGSVIVGAWSTLHNAERAWRYRLIRWDALAGLDGGAHARPQGMLAAGRQG
jgi:hypothetical protein